MKTVSIWPVAATEATVTYEFIISQQTLTLWKDINISICFWHNMLMTHQWGKTQLTGRYYDCRIFRGGLAGEAMFYKQSLDWRHLWRDSFCSLTWHCLPKLFNAQAFRPAISRDIVPRSYVCDCCTTIYNDENLKINSNALPHGNS